MLILAINSLYNENGHYDRYLYIYIWSRLRRHCLNIFIASLLISLSPHCWEFCFVFLCCKIFEIVKVKSIKYPASRAFFPARTLYESFVWQTFTSLGLLFTWHFYIRMYCMPTATLNQKKQFQLLYLGDVQIISFI